MNARLTMTGILESTSFAIQNKLHSYYSLHKTHSEGEGSSLVFLLS